MDKPICVEINLSKAFCTYTISNQDFIVDDEHPYAFNPKKPDDKKTWFEMRPAMVLMPPSTWAAFKAYVIKQCKKYKCDGIVEGWDRTTGEVDKKLTDKGVAIETPVP